MIGGDKYLAILHSGHVEGAPDKNDPPMTGIALNGSQIYNSGVYCTGMRPGTKGFALDQPAEECRLGSYARTVTETSWTAPFTTIPGSPTAI